MNHFKDFWLIKAQCRGAAKRASKFGEPIFGPDPFDQLLDREDLLKSGQAALFDDTLSVPNVLGEQEKSVALCVYDLRRETVVDIKLGPRPKGGT